MKKEDIHWDDWHRIFIGTAPTSFLWEVLLRTVVMYLVLLVILRLMGKRMGGQLTTTELAIAITLGAIICVPMQIQDKGVVQGIFVLICALAFHRIFTWFGVISHSWEKTVQGESLILLKDGVLEVEQLKKSDMSRQQIYAILRSQNIYNLGEVERIYLEGSGRFSVFRMDPPQPGLIIMPPSDRDAKNIQQTPDSELHVCVMCGKTTSETIEQQNCNNCGAQQWEKATLA